MQTFNNKNSMHRSKNIKLISPYLIRQDAQKERQTHTRKEGGRGREMYHNMRRNLDFLTLRCCLSLSLSKKRKRKRKKQKKKKKENSTLLISFFLPRPTEQEHEPEAELNHQNLRFIIFLLLISISFSSIPLPDTRRFRLKEIAEVKIVTKHIEILLQPHAPFYLHARRTSIFNTHRFNNVIRRHKNLAYFHNAYIKRQL